MAAYMETMNMRTKQQLRRRLGARTRFLMAALAAALAVSGASATVHGQDWDNKDRYLVLKGALVQPAPHTSAWASGLAGVAFDTPDTPITFQNYDTPDRRSFAAENVAKIIFGPKSGGLGAADWVGSPLGTLCTYMNGRTYGILSDIRYYWSTAVAAP